MKRTCCPTIPFKKVTHIIFGLDGTILDTETVIQEILTEICNRHEKDFSSYLHNKTAGAVVEEIAQLLISELDLPLTEQEFIDMYKERAISKCTYTKFMPGAEELIRHFHTNSIPMAIATCSTEELMLLKTQNHREIFDLFHHVVCGGTDPNVIAGKPSPEIFQVCVSRFEDSPNPSDCLVLESTPNGILAAERAGMQVVMIPADDVPHEIWKNATLRLDSMEFMAPELFGLPALLNQSYPIPKISFTMHYDGEVKKEEPKEEKPPEEKKKRKKDSLFEEDPLLEQEYMFANKVYK